VDWKGECSQLNLAYVTRNKYESKKPKQIRPSAHLESGTSSRSAKAVQIQHAVIPGGTYWFLFTWNYLANKYWSESVIGLYFNLLELKLAFSCSTLCRLLTCADCGTDFILTVDKNDYASRTSLLLWIYCRLHGNRCTLVRPALLGWWTEARCNAMHAALARRIWAQSLLWCEQSWEISGGLIIDFAATDCCVDISVMTWSNCDHTIRYCRLITSFLVFHVYKSSQVAFNTKSNDNRTACTQCPNDTQK